MKIIEVLTVAVAGTSFAVLLRPVRPELSMVTGAVTGLAVLGMVLAELTGLVDAIREIAAENGVDGGYVGTLLKILGIAYLAEFGVGVCKDAGESAVAGKVELCGRVLILASAMPAAVSALGTAVSLLRELPS